MASEIPDDWFETTARENFERAFLPATNRENLRYLQIGAFTGNASVWLLENVLTHPTSVLVDVDTWDGGSSWEMEGFNWDDIEALYDTRTRGWQSNDNLVKIKLSSYQFFTNFGAWAPYDFIYIDGAHDAVSVIEDAVMAYRVLKPGGLIAFDDYTWQSKYGMLYEPWPAIDAIKVLYAGRLQVLRVGEQCWMKRVDAEVRP